MTLITLKVFQTFKQYPSIYHKDDTKNNYQFIHIKGDNMEITKLTDKTDIVTFGDDVCDNLCITDTGKKYVAWCTYNQIDASSYLLDILMQNYGYPWECVLVSPNRGGNLIRRLRVLHNRLIDLTKKKSKNKYSNRLKRKLISSLYSKINATKSDLKEFNTMMENR